MALPEHRTSMQVLDPRRSIADVRFDGDEHTETHRTTYSSKAESEPRSLHVELETGVGVYGFWSRRWRSRNHQSRRSTR
jgi:hypothetical protein